MPRVSVIIPSYNHEKYVAEAIQSVLEQTYQDFEIIITDDGSRDRTVEIIKQFRDSRIKLYCFPKNRGAVIAANHCIQNARGEFIALLNSDDVFERHKLEKQVNFLDNYSEIGAVFSYAQFIGENSQPLKQVSNYQDFNQENRTRFEWLNYFFYHGNCLCHPSILIRKECYQTVGLYDPRLAQLPDFDFWLRLCQQYEIYIIPEKLIKFRIRDNEANASGDTHEKKIRMYFETYQVFENFFDIEKLDDLKRIFPEISKTITCQEDINNRDLAIFGLAKIALSNPMSSIKYLGLNTLYKLLNNQETILNLKQDCDFDFIDLIKITEQHEIFTTPEVLSKAKLIKNSRLWRLWESWNQLKQFFQQKTI